MTGDPGVRIHHRKYFNTVMLIPSKDRMVARRSGRDPQTRMELPAVVTQKMHRILLDHNGDAEITLSTWHDIERSGFGNHFLLMPGPVTNPMTQKFSAKTTAKVHEHNVVKLHDGDTHTTNDKLRTTWTQFSTKIRQSIRS